MKTAERQKVQRKGSNATKSRKRRRLRSLKNKIRSARKKFRAASYESNTNCNIEMNPNCFWSNYVNVFKWRDNYNCRAFRIYPQQGETRIELEETPEVSTEHLYSRNSSKKTERYNTRRSCRNNKQYFPPENNEVCYDTEDEENYTTEIEEFSTTEVDDVSTTGIEQYSTTENGNYSTTENGEYYATENEEFYTTGNDEYYTTENEECYEDQEGENGENDYGDEESDCEYVLSDEFLEFLVASRRHKEEMRLKKEAEENANKKPISERDNIEECRNPEGKSIDSQRLEEMNALYGDSAAKIMGMETALQLTFNRHCDLNKPPYWPCLPLNIKFC